MNAFERKVALRVTGIHVAVILGFVMVSAMRGCFRPKPKPEIVTFIEFGQPAPQVAVEEVAQMSDPEPAPEPEPEPAPEPEPMKTIPEKPKKTIKPPKEMKKPEPVKKKPPKKKWTPAPIDDIKIGKKVGPSKPAVSEKDIKKALSGIATKPGPVGNPNANSAYIAKIGNYFDRYWKHPASASSAQSTIVRIHISKSGAITGRKKIQGSGDSVFDQSVMSAVNSVKTVPPPPSGFPYDYVEVEFRIRN
ncbi:MAG: TonB C-terminal domain-containing protein [Kiritimatiellaceae bacterium]|nr:TonB C-terminal domain-containing protein [Kiritimatiellaceae bacterium]